MVDVYSRDARRFFDQYRQLSFGDVHRQWLSSLPGTPGFALDVGAGSGRDAQALAERGWEVLAVEPAAGLRELGEEATQGRSVQWLDDRLPELARVRTLGHRFNLILVSAVWMHVPPTQRERAFRIVSELLAPGGQLIITLRHGPASDDRTFYETDPRELEAWARKRALICQCLSPDTDRLAREDVWWETLTFSLPDDGTGALPTLRHIIVNDAKASTYKLALLRSLARIADGMPGMVLARDDNWVDIPLGLVALVWIKLYQPLILQHNLRVAPGSQGYGFAGEAFYALKDVSPMDIRVGQSLSGELAPTLLKAIRDAAQTITRMPARYTTWPGSDRPVFESAPRASRIPQGNVRLDRETLARFGTFRVPVLLWDCFSRYTCWLEPAIVNEWAQLMQSYEVRYDTSVYHRALQWEDGRRDTNTVRGILADHLGRNRNIHCVWSNKSLARNRHDIDHCFPWSRWFNNDLWNLVPATSRANAAKSDKLPAAALMHDARPRILQWWEEAFVTTSRELQFFAEAEATLPLVHEQRSLESLFEGVMQQRQRLRVNQQLVEWVGL